MSNSAIQDWINGYSGAGDSSAPVSQGSKIDAWINKKTPLQSYGVTSYTTSTPANSGALDAQAFRAMDKNNTLMQNYQQILSDPVKRDELQAAIYGVPYMSPTNENIASLDIKRQQASSDPMSDGALNLEQQRNYWLGLKNQVDKTISERPAALTDLEKQARTLKSTDTAKYNELINSDAYLNDIVGQATKLSTNGRKLSADEQQQAKDILNVLSKYAKPGTSAFPYNNPNDKYTNVYNALDSKVSGVNAFGANAINTMSMGLINKAAVSANKTYADAMPESDLKKAISSNKYNAVNETTSQNPEASIAGNIAGGAAQMIGGGKILSALGIPAKAVAPVLMGSTSGISAIVRGEPWYNVALDTVTGAFSGYVGGKTASLVAGKVADILGTSTMPNVVKSFIANGSSGLAFGVGMEGVNAASNLAQGKPIDPTSAAINIVVGAVFGTLEAVKGSYKPTSAEYKKIESIQERIQSGDESAIQQAVMYLNDVSKLEGVVKDLETKLSSEQTADTVNAADILDRRRQIQQREYANARESLSRMDAENQVISLANDYLTNDTVRQMEQSGVMSLEVETLRRAYNKAFQIQQRLNWLNSNNGNPAEITAAERTLSSTASDLKDIQQRIANYLKGKGIPQPIGTESPNTELNNGSNTTYSATEPQNAPETRAPSDASSIGAKGKSAAERNIALDNSNPTITDNAKQIKIGTDAPKGEIPAGQVERGFTRNVRTDTAMETPIRETFDTSPESYKQLANKDTLAKAESLFKKGTDAALAELNQRLGSGKINPEDVPLSRMIANDLVKSGNIESARKVISDVAVHLTEAGQLGQAAKILRNGDPISVENTIQKAIDKINDALKAKGSKYRAELTPEELDLIHKTDFSQDGAFEDIYAQVAKRIGAEMGSTLWEKLTEIRRVSMLLNPKTQIRNVAGNVPLAGMRKVSERLAGGVQDILVKMGAMEKAQQTRTLIVGKESKSIAKELYDAHKAELIGASNKWDMNTLLRQYRKYFNNVPGMKWMDNARAFTYELLSKGDMPFLKNAFVDNAAQYIEAQGYKSLADVPRSVVEHASQKALEATFRDASAVARLMNQMKAKGGFGGKALDVLFPFTTTPINIAKRTYEYSPLGAMKLIADIAGKKGASVIIDDMAKTLTGSAVVALGFYFKSLGVITGAADKDKDKAAYDKATGNAPFSFYGNVSYDWLQPIGSLLAMGAEVFDTTKDNKNALEAIYNSTLTAGDAYLNLTFFSNILDMFRGYSSPTETVINTLARSGLSQFAPSLTGAIARAIDPTVRSSESGQGAGQNALNSVIQKMPFASQNLPASVNVKGEENKRIENPLIRTIQEMFNPANISTGTSNAVDKELNALYGSTGDKTVFPRTAPKNIDGVDLSGAEIAQYQKTMGQTTYSLLQSLFNSAEYNALSDQEKVKTINNVLDYSTDAAKREYQTSKGKDYSSEWDNKTQLKNLGTDLAYKVAFNQLEKDKGTNSNSFKSLAGVYNNLAPEQQDEINTSINNSTFLKVISAINNGIEPSTYFEWKTRLAELNKTMKPYEANDQWRTDMEADQNLPAQQKNLLDNLLINDITIIPKDVQKDYTSHTTSVISSMSESAQKGYNTYLKGKVDADTYSKAYDFYTAAQSDKDTKGNTIDGRSKMDKVFKYINGLNMNKNNKIQLAYAFGYSKKSVGEYSWR